ncbi:hypothetical protein B0H16DRAFT_1488319 [Mycena metata]|uniref:Uncharacterized protein n=1 Tax=Mycena metata TaxID=1033252 RepID=A0AAD7KIV2_9AGAR|nr:hypothetical protein B0H16DRAFT_1488319 [Mycena metata]
MHQAHNIAWDSLTANLIFISENPAVTPRRTGFFPRELPTQGKTLGHFSRTLASTVREFSDTERAKYPPHFDAPLRGQLFSDTILSRYADLPYPSVTAKSQSIEDWVEWAGSPPSYSTSQGNLADVVKVLIAENQMDQLLMLAQHPRVPLFDLHQLSWGHSFGWDHLRDWALEAYIFFNVLLSKPELHTDDRYKSITEYRWLCRKLTYPTDYDAQTFPHRQFFWGSAVPPAVREEEFDPLGDSNKLHEYLKMCFRLLYRYDMLVRECGQTVDWEGCVACAVAYLWNIKTDYAQDEKGDTVIRFV